MTRAFGLGFAHAQDRLFQMEVQRRYGAGRLAEIFGEAAVPIDTQMRVLGLYRAAEAAWPSSAAAVRSGIEAYCAGRQRLCRDARLTLPPEFVMLRFKPGTWTPADTLVWGKLMDFQLGGNYRGELLRARLAQTVSAEDMAFLYPDYPRTARRPWRRWRRSIVACRLAASMPRCLPGSARYMHPITGSSTAPIAPAASRFSPTTRISASARPASGISPGSRRREREIAGATVAGNPMVVIGHNDKIAWGFTTTTADIEDLFIEKLDPKDPARYLTPDGSAAFVTRQETIVVRGAAPVVLTVRATRHGPVISDMLPAGTFEAGYVIALSSHLSRR